MQSINSKFLPLMFLVPAMFACTSVEKSTRAPAQATKSAVTNPDDVLADQQDFNTFREGNVVITARKGTIAAAIKNAMRLNEASCTVKEREEIIAWFKEYAITLTVLFQGQIFFANTLVQEILEHARAEVNARNAVKG